VESKDLHVIEHMEELRSRIIKTLIGFVAFFIMSFIFVQDIYNLLIKDLEGKLAVLGPSEILWVYMIIAGVCAIAATIPLAAYQLWRFVAPALKPEKEGLHFASYPDCSFYSSQVSHLDILCCFQ